MQQRSLYRMGCARLSLIIFWETRSPQYPEGTILYMLLICLIWDCSKFVPQPPLPSPKKAVKLNFGCPDSVLSIFFDFSWGFIFCSAPMGHGGWEPDSVPIKSGPSRSNWNFQGDVEGIIGAWAPSISHMKGWFTDSNPGHMCSQVFEIWVSTQK